MNFENLLNNSNDFATKNCMFNYLKKDKIRSNANNNCSKEKLPQRTSTRDIELKGCFCEDF
jgi:hypothetical protein